MTTELASGPPEGILEVILWKLSVDTKDLHLGRIINQIQVHSSCRICWLQMLTLHFLGATLEIRQETHIKGTK